MASVSPPKHFVLAADSAYFEGLSITISSLLTSLTNTPEISIHILNGGLTSHQQSYIHEASATIAPQAIIEFIAYDPETFSQLPSLRGQSHMTYARLASPHLIAAEQFIYLDCDLLILRDLTDFPLHDLADSICAGVIDPTYPTLSRDCCGISLDARQAKTPYFNAGVLAINRQKWIDSEVTEKCANFLTSHPKARAWDQSAINHVTAPNNRVLTDQSWNRNLTRFSNQSICQPDQNGLAQVYHYIGKAKPWDRGTPLPETLAGQLLYRRFCEHFFKDCPLPDKLPDLKNFSQKTNRKERSYRLTFQKAKAAQWRNSQISSEDLSSLERTIAQFLDASVPSKQLPWPL